MQSYFLHQETNQKQINNFHIEENARSAQFLNFQRADPVSNEPIIQRRDHEEKSDPSEELEKKCQDLTGNSRCNRHNQKTKHC